MDTLDSNIFTDCICPYLTGKIIDNVLLVNKQYNTIVKADMKHLYNLFWYREENILNGGYKYINIYKDGKQIAWYPTGNILCEEFYKEGKQEGEKFVWFVDGQLKYKDLYKDGKFYERITWYDDTPW